jgi:TetR/AcrR family transcriptional regulator
MTRTEADQTSRKDRERERHRREILQAAERIFAREGYHATTVEKIAKESEFAVGTLYNLFKGKEDLYRNVIEGGIRNFMGEFEERVLSVEDSEEAIGALIELRLTHAHEHREFIRTLFVSFPGSGVDPTRFMPSELLEVHHRYLDSVVHLFQQGILRGTFDEADPLYLTLCLEGIINAFIAYWTQNEPVDPLEVRIAKMRREFLERIKLPVNRTLRLAAAH